jgi:hypothetical protein
MKATGENQQLGEKPVPVPLCSPQISHGLDLGSNPGLRGDRPATKRLSHDTALHSLLPSALDGSVWSTICPGRFIPKKQRRYPLNRRLGGPQSRSGRFGENKNLLSLPEFESRTVQHIVGAYGKQFVFVFCFR